MKKILSILGIVVALLFFNGCDNKYDFSLNSEFGKVGLKDFTGKKLVVYFGYTYCPDVCPATLSLLANELKDLNSEQVFLLFISLDPQRDSDINSTNEWLRYFYPNATSLIADNEKTLAQIAQNYGVIYEKVLLPNSIMRYSVAHSNEVFLFDEKGKLFDKINDLSRKSLHQRLEAFLNADK